MRHPTSTTQIRLQKFGDAIGVAKFQNSNIDNNMFMGSTDQPIPTPFVSISGWNSVKSDGPNIYFSAT
jgi:hypothetical protein